MPSHCNLTAFQPSYLQGAATPLLLASLVVDKRGLSVPCTISGRCITMLELKVVFNLCTNRSSAFDR
jgi:hypothetical protein